MIVALVEREPRRGPLLGLGSLQPFGQEGRLTEAGRRRNERQLRRGPLVGRSLSLGRGTRPRRRLGT
jgi:hypothetical protein